MAPSRTVRSACVCSVVPGCSATRSVAGRGGTIPDLGSAADGATTVSTDPALARRLLDLVPLCPVATWGRDEQHAGEMWNSNSLVSWLLVRSGIDVGALAPPPGGRAPGWDAGRLVASRAPGGHPERAPRLLESGR